MENMEHDLQNKKTQPNNAGHTTHGVNNSSKYIDLLSKKSKERVHDQNTEAVFEVHFDIGFN